MAQILGDHHENIRHVLRHDLDIRMANVKWVPHALDSSQKDVWVKGSQELLGFLEGRP
jgi:hypothetical protein